MELYAVEYNSVIFTIMPMKFYILLDQANSSLCAVFERYSLYNNWDILYRKLYMYVIPLL